MSTESLTKSFSICKIAGKTKVIDSNDARWLKLACYISSYSKDPSTQVGAVIVGDGQRVLSLGWNGFPRKVIEDAERWERPQKYQWVEHAERNAIYNAAYHGTSLKGATLYCPLPPCADCARGVVQAGIKYVVMNGDDAFFKRNDWSDSINAGVKIMHEGKVTTRKMYGVIKPLLV